MKVRAAAEQQGSIAPAGRTEAPGRPDDESETIPPVGAHRACIMLCALLIMKIWEVHCACLDDDELADGANAFLVAAAADGAPNALRIASLPSMTGWPLQAAAVTEAERIRSAWRCCRSLRYFVDCIPAPAHARRACRAQASNRNAPPTTAQQQTETETETETETTK